MCLINADSQIAGVGGDLRGYNLFAYCMNNPVNLIDPKGNWPRLITLAVGVVAIAVAVAATIVSAPVVSIVAASVGLVAGAALIIQTHHYDTRQSKNTNLPATPQDADKAGWKNSKEYDPVANPNGDGPSAKFHQFS